MKKKGYHYTSKENWEKIQKEGKMHRYHIYKDEFRPYYPHGVNGIWLWESEPTGVSHAGNIMYQVGSKGSPEIVKLEIEYDTKYRLKYNKSDVIIHHSGSVENWKYHFADKGMILKKDIPAQDIRVIGNYNTIQRLQ